MKLGLQSKFFALTTPLIVLPLLMLGWFAFSQLNEITEEKTLRQMTTLLEQVALQVRDRQRITRANAVLFSNSVLVQKYMISSEEDRYSILQPTLFRQFDSYQKAYPEYRNISIILPDGYVDTSLGEGLDSNTSYVSDARYFQAMSTSSSPDYAGYHHDASGERFYLLVARRIEIIDRSFDPIVTKPELRGYLSITVDLAYLRDQIEGNRVGREGFLFMADGSGRAVLQPENHVDLPVLNREYLPVESASHTKMPIRQIVIGGRDYLMQGSSLDANLKLFVLLPRDELLASSRDLGIAVAGITLLAILVTITLLFLVMRRQLITPIRVLASAAREIGRGNLGVPIEIRSADELGELADVFRDMRDGLQSSHEQVHYLAYHDSVTGLPNRFMFREYLQDAMRDAERSHTGIALLFIDLDNFKRVNDTLGHQAGDELLQELSSRLGSCVRHGDYVAKPADEGAPELVARLGGDEFIILLPGVEEREIAERVAQRVQDVMRMPMQIQGQEIHVSGSIGITLYPDDGNDPATLIKHADIAMYHAKSLGRNNYQFYTHELNGHMARQLDLENRLRRAIRDDRLVLHYQPVVEIGSLSVTGAEALVRWEDNEQGTVYPDVFIPLAEETGLIVPLGEWVLREACRQCAEWHAAGLSHLRVAVNLSAVQLQRHDLVATIQRALHEADLPAAALELELTETSLLEIGDQAVQLLQELSQLGVSLALDDFGTGYSSLVHLKRFCFDRLKIDRSFVRDLETDEDDAAICAAIIAMAHKLGIQVTAEGVEEQGQLNRLAAWSCDHLQGYLISRPQPNEAFLAFLEALKDAGDDRRYRLQWRSIMER